MSSTRSYSVDSDSSLEVGQERETSSYSSCQSNTNVDGDNEDEGDDDESLSFCQRTGTSRHSEVSTESQSDSSLSIRSEQLTEASSNRMSARCSSKPTTSSHRSRDSIEEFKEILDSNSDCSHLKSEGITPQKGKRHSAHSASGESEVSDTYLSTPGSKKNRRTSRVRKPVAVDYELSTDDGDHVVGSVPQPNTEVVSDIPIITVTDNGVSKSPFRVTPPDDLEDSIEARKSMEWFRDSSPTTPPVPNNSTRSVIPNNNPGQFDYVPGRFRQNFSHRYGRAYSARVTNRSPVNIHNQPRRAVSAPRARLMNPATDRESEQSSSVHTVPPSRGRVYNGVHERFAFRNNKRYLPVRGNVPSGHKQKVSYNNTPLVWEESSDSSVGYPNKEGRQQQHDIAQFTGLLHSVTSITQAAQLEHQLASKLLGRESCKGADRHVLQLEGLCANMLASNMREKHRRMTQLAHSIASLEQSTFIRLVGRYYLRLVLLLKPDISSLQRDLHSASINGRELARYQYLHQSESERGRSLKNEIVRLIATQIATIDAHQNTSRKNVASEEASARVNIQSRKMIIEMCFVRMREIIDEEAAERRRIRPTDRCLVREPSDKIAPAVRPYLGLEISNGIHFAGDRYTESGALLTGTDGVVVVAVDPRGPSSHCLNKSDIITHINNEYIVDAHSFKRIISLLTCDTWRRIDVAFLRATEHSPEFTYFTECVGVIEATSTTKPLQQKRATCQFGMKPHLWAARRSPTRVRSCPSHSRSPPPQSVRRHSPGRASPHVGRSSPGKRLSRSPVRRTNSELRTPPPSPWAVGSALFSSRSPSPRKILPRSTGSSFVEF